MQRLLYWRVGFFAIGFFIFLAAKIEVRAMTRKKRGIRADERWICAMINRFARYRGYGSGLAEYAGAAEFGIGNMV